MKKDKSGMVIVKAFTMILQLGLTIIVTMIGCVWIGHMLDQWLNTGFLTILMIFIGMGASFRSCYHLTKNFYQKDYLKEEESRKSIHEGSKRDSD